MICEECKKENKKSEVRENYSTKTLMGSYPYYDEEGKYHDHDINIITHFFSCSNDHEFIKVVSGSCWCGWSNNPRNNSEEQAKTP